MKKISNSSINNDLCVWVLPTLVELLRLCILIDVAWMCFAKEAKLGTSSLGLPSLVSLFILGCEGCEECVVVVGVWD